MQTQNEFWKDNQISGHFTLTTEEVKTKFKDWLIYQHKENTERGADWITYYYGYELIRCFIGDKEVIKGLQSVNTDQSPEFMEPLAQVYREYCTMKDFWPNNK